MSDNASWYAQKMAALRGQPVQQPPPQQYTPPTQWSPQHQQTIAVQQAEAYSTDPAVPPGQIKAIDAVNRWRGKDGTRLERDPCPECGSNNFFSRRNGASKRPAPHCFDCGYNGLYSQGLVDHG